MLDQIFNAYQATEHIQKVMLLYNKYLDIKSVSITISLFF